MLSHRITRAVLIATQTPEQDLGAPHDWPMCLMPCGTQSLIERQLDQFAHLGILDVDLVVSDHPDALRQVVGQGEKWGLQIHWHWVQSDARAYSALRSFDWHGVDKVLFARADQWISDRALKALLLSENLMLVRADQPSVWTGWACCHKDMIIRFAQSGSVVEMGLLLQSHISTTRKIILRQDWAAPATPADMVELQQRALCCEGLQAAAATWIRKPWGLMSPQAWVDPQARITGPVLVGPGCFVAAHAKLGPNTVLCRDVIVDSRTHLSDTLALPGVYLGKGLELRHSMVIGHKVIHVRSRTSSHLPSIQARRLDRHPSQTQTRTSWSGRAIAAMVLLGGSPLVAADWALRRTCGRNSRWHTQPVVHGHLAQHNGLRVHLLNEPTAQTSLWGRALSQYGRVIDIAQGKRHWFGVRARNMGQWHQLNADWQSLLARTPIGLIHATAWREAGEVPSAEAAAADVFYAVSPTWKTRLHMCLGMLHQSTTPHLPAAVAV